MQTELEARPTGPTNATSSPTLLPLWTAHLDPNSGLTYYYNTQTGVTQWHAPELDDTPAGPLDRGISGPQPYYPALQEQSTSVQTFPGSYPSLQPQQQLQPPFEYSQPTQSRRKETSLPPIASGPLNKDYTAMAKEYSKFAAYRNARGNQPCLLCPGGRGAAKAPSTHIFFPCGHKCVCMQCIRTHKIRNSGSTSLGDGQDEWCFCPLCNDEIKRITEARSEGGEENEYWKWVNEVTPVLPKGFKQRLNRATNAEEGLMGVSSSGTEEAPGGGSSATSIGSRRGSFQHTSKAPKSGACALS